MEYNVVVILGATTTGKTQLAVKLALTMDAEIISADSRQVYRHMNIGTGKDINEYENTNIAYHLIDIVEPEENFSYS